MTESINTRRIIIGFLLAPLFAMVPFILVTAFQVAADRLGDIGNESFLALLVTAITVIATFGFHILITEGWWAYGLTLVLLVPLAYFQPLKTRNKSVTYVVAGIIAAAVFAAFHYWAGYDHLAGGLVVSVLLMLAAGGLGGWFFWLFAVFDRA